jgi:two-component system, OmpR family, sensor histidine kinase KdpD
VAEDRADTFLRMIQRSRRGRLKVYLGYAAGVGKTYQMLREGHRLKTEGIDVVVGLVETHGRVETAQLVHGLEVVPRVGQEYHGIAVDEMDVDAILARKPEVVLIDELAHTNIPGSRNHKRYQDVQDVLAVGIHVITTVNVQHLESLYDTVERGLGVAVRERLPDSVLAQADEIINIDLSTEDLRQRLKEGRVYPEQRTQTALVNFFTPSNLEQLRELTLRELASQIDLRRRETVAEEGQVTTDQVMVCLSSRGPNSEMLLRYASRLAGRLSRNWYAVYVQTPDEGATTIDATTQRLISNTMTMAKQLGGMVFTYKGENVVETILRFAKEYRVGHIVVGSPTEKPFWKRLIHGTSLVHRLIDKADGVAIVVVDTGARPAARAPIEIIEEEQVQTEKQRVLPPRPDRFLARSVLFWDDPVAKGEVIRALVHVACKEIPGCDEASALRAVLKREEEGSTFFNEGLAIPHGRLRGLITPGTALGVTRGGILGEVTDMPIGYVFLSITPEETPETQIEILAAAVRAFQDRLFLQALDAAVTADDIKEVAASWAEFQRRTQSVEAQQSNTDAANAEKAERA